jgi:hypothetical protein
VTDRMLAALSTQLHSKQVQLIFCAAVMMQATFAGALSRALWASVSHTAGAAGMQRVQAGRQAGRQAGVSHPARAAVGRPD